MCVTAVHWRAIYSLTHTTIIKAHGNSEDPDNNDDDKNNAKTAAAADAIVILSMGVIIKRNCHLLVLLFSSYNLGRGSYIITMQ